MKKNYFIILLLVVGENFSLLNFLFNHIFHFCRCDGNIFSEDRQLKSFRFINSQPTPSPTTQSTFSFSYTGSVQSVTVPGSATAMFVDISGAASGTAGSGGTPGKGARVQTQLPVTPGTVIYIYVGGKGGVTAGGFNGGGNGGGGSSGGGGASDIRLVTNSLTSRIVVAGGGGGYCPSCCASSKGGDGGQIGGEGGTNCCASGGKAGGGTSTEGGIGGTSTCASEVAQSGSLGAGGNGITGDNTGGGGGGYYGGGGGANGGSGGGGSSYSAAVDPALTIYTTGYQASFGSVTLSFHSVPTSQPTSLPSRLPSSQPSAQPTHPTGQPSSRPSIQPSPQPSSRPNSHPSLNPTSQPTRTPSSFPSLQPVSHPSSLPSVKPTCQPTDRPSVSPSGQPSGQPTSRPIIRPSSSPSSRPSNCPSRLPISHPSVQPSCRPTKKPSTLPSVQPSGQPSFQPVAQPSAQPTAQPSDQPTALPVARPSSHPSSHPSKQPRASPSAQPSSQPSSLPTTQPFSQPTSLPSEQPTGIPSCNPSCQPSRSPTTQPISVPSSQPSSCPSDQPTSQPSLQPSTQPSRKPSVTPSSGPSMYPTVCPTSLPTINPSSQPTTLPTGCPFALPSSVPSLSPSFQPSNSPTSRPSSFPSSQPSEFPSSQPIADPSSQPTTQPTSNPSGCPTSVPSKQPSSCPTSVPSIMPSNQPTKRPSCNPTRQPTGCPSSQPSNRPSNLPTSIPSVQPVAGPSSLPSSLPSNQPTGQPSSKPTLKPTCCPTSQPSKTPSSQPSLLPSSAPTSFPSSNPSLQPINEPTSIPTDQPSCRPTTSPSHQPTSSPSSQPVSPPTSRPSSQPTMIPTAQPFAYPTSAPVATIYQTNGILFWLGATRTTSISNNITQNSNSDGTQGTSYILFGRNLNHQSRFPSTISLGSTASEEFVSEINNNDGVGDGGGGGGIRHDITIRSTTIIGDINGDGFDDLLVGYPLASKCSVYLGNGVDDFTTIIATTGESFAIVGDPYDGGGFLGWSSIRIGDLNGDEFDEIIISAIFGNTVYVLYGRREFNQNPVKVNEVTAQTGFKIVGHSEEINFGVSLTLIHDFRKGSRADLAVTAQKSLGGQNIIYVLFGVTIFSKNTINKITELKIEQVMNNSSACFKIVAPSFSYAGFSLAGIGDINSDGYDDLAIGSVPYSRGKFSTQRTYVIYGRSVAANKSNNELQVSTMGADDGFVINGGGFLVTAVGDVNYDGINDLMITDYSDWKDQSCAYVITTPSNMTRAPSLQPSSRPTVIIITSPPSSNISLTITSSTVTQNMSTPIPTQRPSRVPSSPPNTSEPTLEPSRLLLAVGTSRPTHGKPSLSPTITPTSGYHRLRGFPPSVHPTTMKPSVNITTDYYKNYLEIDCSKSGEYTGMNETNYKFIIRATSGMISISGNDDEAAKNLFVLYCPPSQDSVNVMIKNFRLSTDIISVAHLSEAGYLYHSVSEIPFSLKTGSLKFFFCAGNKLQVDLSSHTSFDLSESNFLFLLLSNGKQQNSSEDSVTARIQIGIAFGILLLFIVIIYSTKGTDSSSSSKKEISRFQDINSEDGENNSISSAASSLSDLLRDWQQAPSSFQDFSDDEMDSLRSNSFFLSSIDAEERSESLESAIAALLLNRNSDYEENEIIEDAVDSNDSLGFDLSDEDL
jgi:hypothetical protein